MLDLYQHLPHFINPVVFSLGPFSLHWYSLMYVAGFIAVYLLLKWRLKHDVTMLKVADYKLQDVQNFLLYAAAGLLIGARLGYVFIYDFSYFTRRPLEIFLPLQVTGDRLQVTGIYGMSYFGGLLGVIIAGLVFCRKYKIGFWQLADFVIPAIPAGYFFGRIGNFLNGELYGRATNMPWGMYFPADNTGLLRHPSQLYEAFFEGIVLFIILWTLRNKSSVVNGRLLVIYLASYGFFRFFCEFFREPDPGVGFIFGWLTLGQIFSAMAIIAAVFIVLARRKLGISQYSKSSL